MGRAIRLCGVDRRCPRRLRVEPLEDRRLLDGAAALPISPGDVWHYFKGTEQPPADWTGASFDDSAWPAGPTGIGYGDGDDATVLDDMPGNYVSVYARRAFDVDDPASIESLTLTIDYDDGFIAYVNGVEVARSNVAGNPPAFDSTATTNHEAFAGNGDPDAVETFDVGAVIDHLAEGTNVLAIEGHNVSFTSSDFSLIPSLDYTRGPATYYVDADATGYDNGQSWANAFVDLQDALAVVADGDAIHVAQGVYAPAGPDGPRDATFQLVDGVRLVGGFAGIAEADPGARDVGLYDTVLTGDLKRDDVVTADPAELSDNPTRAENVFHVVTGPGTGESALLDGFVVTGGNADASAGQHGRGGGLYNSHGYIELVDCSFVANSARSEGGAVYNDQADATITECWFGGNSALWRGGALWSNGDVELRNSVFTGNSAERGGGFYTFNTDPTLVHCTFVGNSARTGGGMYGDDDTYPELTNCIFWANTDDGGMDESAQMDLYSPQVGMSFNCVQGWTGTFGGAGNIGADPRFVDALGADGIPGTEDDDLRLLPDSPCIDAGTDEGVATDLDGTPRPIDVPGVDNNGSSPEFDIGAYEFVPVPQGAIRGSKFHDLDGNGVRDDGEPGLPGWTIYLDTNADGALNSDESSTLTGPGGHYAIEGLSQGTYVVAEIPQDGWQQTAPERGWNDIDRVNIAYDGSEANDSSSEPSLSHDGRFVAFASDASNLVPGDTNRNDDVFVVDRTTGAIELVSAGWDGSPGDGDSGAPSISADGRFVAFTSYAANIVSDDANDRGDIFVFDRETGLLDRATAATDASGDPRGSYDASISADGRFVAFTSYADNLVPNGTGHVGVFVVDRQTGAIEQANVNASGVPAGSARNGAVSADGRFVAFDTVSALVPEDDNGRTDAYVYDRLARSVELASVNGAGTVADSWSEHPSISADGRFVAFDSKATNLVPGDTNGQRDIFVRDRVAGTTERVSVGTDGVQGDWHCYYPSISGDGRSVAFLGWARNLVPDDTNGRTDAFVFDRHAGTLQRASTDSDGSQGAADTWSAAVSGDGKSVAFDSPSDNFVGGDTNGRSDVFVARTVAAGLAGTHAVELAIDEVVDGVDFGNHALAGPPAGFDFSWIGPIRFAGGPIDTTLTAVDSAGFRVAGFDRSVPLRGWSVTDEAFVDVSPATVPLADGSWTGEIVVLEPAEQIYLVLDDGAGLVSNSEVFEVQAAPLDHFEWSHVATPQTAGAPIDVTLTAVDVFGNTATEFDGPVELAGIVNRGQTVALGGESGSWNPEEANHPLRTSHRAARTQIIYPGGLGDEARVVTGLAINVLETPGGPLEDWTIRMKHTPLTHYPYPAAWEQQDWTTVFQGDVTIGTTGWVDFEFTTPFLYDGVDHLMVDLSFNNSSTSFDGLCAWSYADDTTGIYYADDGQFGDPLDWASIDSPAPNRSEYMLDVQLTTAGNVPIAPATTGELADGVWSGRVAVLEPARDVRLEAHLPVEGGAGKTFVSIGNPFDVVSAPLVNVVPVPVAVPSEIGSDALPEPIQTVPAGGTYFVEVWVRDAGSAGAGIAGGTVDLHYTTHLADVTELVHLDFPALPSGQVDDAAGLVDDFGGGTFELGAGATPAWTRLGYVEVAAAAMGNVEFDLSAGALPFSLAGGGNVDWDDVDLGDAVVVQQGRPTTRIDMTVVREATAFDDSLTGEVLALPANEPWLGEWEPFWVELWMSTPAGSVLGVTEASIDLTYGTWITSAVSVEHGPAFDNAPDATIDDSNGWVFGLGGETDVDGVGDDGFALLARIRFEPGSEDQAVVNESGHSIGPYLPGLLLDDWSIELEGVGPVPSHQGPHPVTQIFAVPYDVDDDDVIDFGDFSHFTPAFGSSVGAAEPPFSWWADFDKSMHVDFADFGYFAPNFARGKSDGAVVVPPNYPEAWLSGPPVPPAPAAPASIVIDPPEARIDVQLTATAAPGPFDTVESLPASLAQVAAGEAYFVEVWLQETGEGALGVAGGYVDLEFTGTRARAVDVSAGDIFSVLSGGAIDNGAGRIDDLGGGTFTPGAGADGHWVRLGYVRFETTDAGQIDFALSPGDEAFGRWGAGAVDPSNVEWGTLTLNLSDAARVVGRQTFYGNSALSAYDPAVATDKTALLPGQTATYANYTSFDRGINGIVIDVADLSPTADAGGFRFHVRTGSHDDGWNRVYPSETQILPGAGTDQSDRVVVAFDDYQITNTWLRVTVESGSATGLEQPDVFYFGNAVGETGNDALGACLPTVVLTNAADVVAVRDNPRGPSNPASIDNRFDVNRDGHVDAVDIILARNNAGGPLSALPLLRPVAGEPQSPPAGGERSVATATADEPYAALNAAAVDRAIDDGRSWSTREPSRLVRRLEVSAR